MKQRFLSFLLALLLLISMLPYGIATAADNSDVIYFEDGSSLEITVTKIESITRAQTTQGATIYTYKDGNGVIQWKATLTGTFSHDGTTSTCILASCALDIYDNNWYKDSLYTSWSGDTATTELVMGELFLGVTVAKYPYTITLTCDKDGNLS